MTERKEPTETREQYLGRIQIFDRDRVKGQYCAFIDILGFGAATLMDFPHVLEVYERLLDKSELVSSFHPGLKVSVYSDSFVAVSDELGDVVAAAQALQWATLFENHLVRGGIAFGVHAEGEKAGVNFIVSSAVTKAAAIEKTVRWPCVALHPEITLPDEWWMGKGRPLLFFEGLRVVSPFNMMWFRSARTRVSQLLRDYPEHAQKYNWFLRLYDAVDSGEALIPPDVLERLREKYPPTSSGG